MPLKLIFVVFALVLAIIAVLFCLVSDEPDLFDVLACTNAALAFYFASLLAPARVNPPNA